MGFLGAYTISGLTVDVEIILSEQYKRAKEILIVHKNEFDNVKKELLKHNELYKDGFIQALAGNEIKKTCTSMEKPKRFLPAKKEYCGPSKLIGSVEVTAINSEKVVPKSKETSSTKKEMPFSLLEVAKALEVDPTKIREVKADLFGDGIEIKFKPSFHDHSHMEKQSTVLKNNDVENLYMADYSFGEPHLHIYSQGLGDFSEFVKKRNQLDISNENGTNVHRFRP